MATPENIMIRSRFTIALFLVITFFLALQPTAHAQWMPRNPVKAVQKRADSVIFTQETGYLKLQICSDSIIHVLYSLDPFFKEHPNYVVIKTSWDTPPWTMQETPEEVTIKTAHLAVSVARLDGAITYRDLDGHAILQDANRWLNPVKVNG